MEFLIGIFYLSLSSFFAWNAYEEVENIDKFYFNSDRYFSIQKVCSDLIIFIYLLFKSIINLSLAYDAITL